MNAEYGSYPDSARAKATVHIEMYSPYLRATVKLIHSTAGYEPAGSCARWVDEYWAVRWQNADGGFHGARYTAKHQAVNHLDRIAAMN